MMAAVIAVTPGFVALALIGIAMLALLVLAGLFAPSLDYRMSAKDARPNDSEEFLDSFEALTDAKANRNCRFEVLTNGPAFYEAELDAIGAAKNHVNLGAYIFDRGEIGGRFVKALAKRARAGVEVKVMLDSFGSHGAHDSFFRELLQAGGKVARYNGPKWYHILHMDNRTHRELMVMDGRVAFIGGAGVADQWWKGKGTDARWRDTMVRVEGDAVASLQASFAENWLEACGELLSGVGYFPAPAPGASEGDGLGLVINSTPSTGGSTRARMLFQLLLASATKSIHLTTPYFLPDAGLTRELERAVQERKVEVMVLVPGKKSDHLLTRSASRRGYGPLLKAGARVFEYQPTMIHAKVLLVDGLWGVVGSTNFDQRSFGINDEVNLAVRRREFVARLEEDFQADLAESREMTLEEWRKRPWVERAPELLGWVLQHQQ